MFNQGEIKLSWFSCMLSVAFVRKLTDFKCYPALKENKDILWSLLLLTMYMSLLKICLSNFTRQLQSVIFWRNFYEGRRNWSKRRLLTCLSFLYHLAILWASVCKIYLSMKQEIQLSVMCIYAKGYQRGKLRHMRYELPANFGD